MTSDSRASNWKKINVCHDFDNGIVFNNSVGMYVGCVEQTSFWILKVKIDFTVNWEKIRVCHDFDAGVKSNQWESI